MGAVRCGKVDAVLVWKLDRFGRSALDVLANIRDLDAAGVRFIATTQGIDIRPGGDAMSRLILGVLASVAEFERDLIRERTRLGMAKARETGKRIGRPQVSRPERTQVARLREQRRSWREMNARLLALRCTVRGRVAVPGSHPCDSARHPLGFFVRVPSGGVPAGTLPAATFRPLRLGALRR
jgi:putative DNA-invertase from lambdoid prophage Rac